MSVKGTVFIDNRWWQRKNFIVLRGSCGTGEDLSYTSVKSTALRHAEHLIDYPRNHVVSVWKFRQKDYSYGKQRCVRPVLTERVAVFVREA